MVYRYTLSQCILGSIILSTLLTALGCTACAVLLVVFPFEPYTWLYNSPYGGVYTFYPAIVLLLAAIATLVTSVTGCCAVCKDSKVTLIIFSLCFSGIAALYLASSATMFAFLHMGEVEGEMNSSLVDQMMRYDASASGNHYMDRLQQENECCGVTNFTDWRELNTSWWFYHKNVSNASVPSSCCESMYRDDNCAEDLTHINRRGCLEPVLTRLDILVDIVLGVTIILTVLQVITSCMGCYGSHVIWKYEQYDVL